MDGALDICVWVWHVKALGAELCFLWEGKGETYNSFSVFISEELLKQAVHQKAFFSVVGSKQEDIEMLRGKLTELAAAFADQSIEL